MQLASTAFIFVVLPVYLALFLLSPAKLRPVTLLAISLSYYMLVQPGALPVVLACAAMDFAALSVMRRFSQNERLRLGCLIFSVSKNVLLLVWAGVAAMPGSVMNSALGLQVYVLSAIGCVTEAWRRESPCEGNPVRFAVNCLFFPRLYAGPLSGYGDLSKQLDAPNPGLRDLGYGAVIFARGAVKIAVFSELLQTLYDNLRAFSEADATVVSAWCSVLVLSLTIYYRFGGLADVSRGLARMFGVRLPENFDYPYQAHSTQNFLRRFNMTLGQFLSRTLYPDGEENAMYPPLANCLALLSSGALMGLWFGFRTGYLLWGLYLALFAVMERYAYAWLLEGIPSLFRRMYTLCVVLTSFAFFDTDSVAQGMAILSKMLGMGTPRLINDRLIYLLTSNWLLLAVSLVFSTRLLSLPATLLRRRAPRVCAVVSAVAGAFLLALLIIFTA